MMSCKGVELDYERHMCIGLSRNEIKPVVFIQPTMKPINSFEKICLNGNLNLLTMMELTFNSP